MYSPVLDTFGDYVSLHYKNRNNDLTLFPHGRKYIKNVNHANIGSSKMSLFLICIIEGIKSTMSR